MAQQSLHSLRRLHRAGCNLVLTVSTFDAESPPHLDALEICGIALMPELMYALRQGGRAGEACRAIAQQASAQRIPVMATGVVDEAMAPGRRSAALPVSAGRPCGPAHDGPALPVLVLPPRDAAQLSVKVRASRDACSGGCVVASGLALMRPLLQPGA